MSNLGLLTNEECALTVRRRLLQTRAVNLTRAEKPRDSNLKLFKPLLIALKKLRGSP